MASKSLITVGKPKKRKSGGLKKLPKKPSASASLQTLENWLRRVEKKKKENDRIRAEKKKKDALLQKIRSINNYV